MAVLKYWDETLSQWLPVAPGPKGDKGDKGDTGDLANLHIGTVETGVDAAAEIDGNFEDGYTLDLILPVLDEETEALIARKSNRAETWVDWSARPDGIPTAMDSGHPLTLSRNSYGADADYRVVSGALTNAAAAAGIYASYAEVLLSAPATRIGCEFILPVGSKGGLTMCVWKAKLTDTFPTIPDASCHFQVVWADRVTWKFGVFNGGVLTDILSGTYPVPLAADGTTVYRAEVYLIGNTAFILLPDNTWATVTDARIGGNAGAYPCWEIMSDGAYPPQRILRMWADSGNDYRDDIGTLTQVLKQLPGRLPSNAETGTNAAARTGASNTASASHSTVGGGLSNTASGVYATVLGGRNNLANWDYATALGYGAKSVAYGGFTHSAGYFSVQGDAQSTDLVLRCTTTDATPTMMGTNGVTSGYSGQIPVGVIQAYVCEALVVGKNTGALEVGAYRVQFALGRHGGDLVQIGSTVVTVLGEDDAAWDVGVSVDAGAKAFTLLVTGASGKTIHWVASMRCVGAF